MASRGAASERMAAMEAAIGFGRIGVSQGLAALQAATQHRAPALLAMMPVQWHRVLGGGGVVPSFLSEMAPRTALTSSAPAAAAAAAQQSSSLSLEVVLEMVKRTAGSAVDADAPLMEAGVDSLGAVELRNQLQRAVSDGVPLSSTLMFDHPTARQVAHHLQGSQPAAPHAARIEQVGVQGAAVTVAGVSMALPFGVSQIQALRRVSQCGRDLLQTVPFARWDVEQAAHDYGIAPGGRVMVLAELEAMVIEKQLPTLTDCLLYTSPSPRDRG
mgnify:CR=1 FL=1